MADRRGVEVEDVSAVGRGLDVRIVEEARKVLAELPDDPEFEDYKHALLPWCPLVHDSAGRRLIDKWLEVAVIFCLQDGRPY